MRKSALFVAFFLFFPIFAQAQSVDLLWEGEGYTAPFYLGRTLWSKQAPVTFMAIPQGLGNPALLEFRWSKNGTVLGSNSGIGKNSLRFIDTVFGKPVTVSVEVVDNQEVLAEASVSISPRATFVAIFENNPLYGYMFHREMAGSYQMLEEEVTFTGFPYLFNAQNPQSSELSYKWMSNAAENEFAPSVTYRIPPGSSGSSQVSLTLSHSESFMQSASQSFIVGFGENN